MNLRLNNISSIYSNRPQKRQTLGVSVPFGRDESSVDGSESQNTTTVEVGKDKYIVETTTSPAGNVIRKIHKDQYEQKYREESFYDEKTPWDLPKHRSETIFDTEGNILENTNYQHNGSRIESEYKKFVIAQKTTNKIMHMRCYDSRNNLLSETNWVFNNDENQTNYYKDEEIEYYPTMGKKKKTVTTYNPDEINNVAINIKNYNEDGRTLKSETTFSSSKTIRKILNGKEVYIDAFDIKTVRIKADPEIEEVFKDGKLVKKTIFADDGSKRVFTVENRKVVAYSDYDKDDELIGTKIVTRLGEDSAPSFKGTRNAGEGKVEIKPDGRRIETITSTNGKMKTITTKDKFNRLISKKTTAYGTTTTITYDNNQNQQLIETTYPNGLKTSCEYKTFCKKGEEPRTLPMVNRA